MEYEIQAQRKVAGFDSAITFYKKLLREAKSGVISKRKEEFLAYVKRVVFKGSEEGVFQIPDLHTQTRVVSRMKDI